MKIFNARTRKLFLIVGIFLLFFLWLINPIREYFKLKTQLAILRERNKRLQENIENLKLEKKMLEENREEIYELKIREKLGYSCESTDFFYVFVESLDTSTSVQENHLDSIFNYTSE